MHGKPGAGPEVQRAESRWGQGVKAPEAESFSTLGHIMDAENYSLRKRKNVFAIFHTFAINNLHVVPEMYFRVLYDHDVSKFHSALKQGRRHGGPWGA